MGARWEQRALLRVGRRRGRRRGRHGGRAAPRAAPRAAVAILAIVGIVAVAIVVISSRRKARDGCREAHAVRRVQQQVAQCGQQLGQVRRERTPQLRQRLMQRAQHTELLPGRDRSERRAARENVGVVLSAGVAAVRARRAHTCHRRQYQIDQRAELVRMVGAEECEDGRAPLRHRILGGSATPALCEARVQQPREQRQHDRPVLRKHRVVLALVDGEEGKGFSERLLTDEAKQLRLVLVHRRLRPARDALERRRLHLMVGVPEKARAVRVQRRRAAQLW